MLSTFEVVLFSLPLFLLPIVLYQLATNAQPPKNAPLSKLYAAEPRLNFVGNLFLLSLMAVCLVKLAGHFALIEPATALAAEGWVNIPFFLLMVVFLVLFVRAWRSSSRAAG